jgi:hypothetical protein
MMWMKDTLVPLDIIFLSSDGKIVRLAPHAEPLSPRPIPSGGPVSAVLEVSAGTVDRLILERGNKILSEFIEESDEQSKGALQTLCMRPS